MTRLRFPLWRWCLLLLPGLLAACASGPDALRIDRSITATGQNSRVEFLVLHYTNSNTPRSLQLLSQGEVSSHYLITDDTPPRIYQLVDESRRAWHAGDSAWRGRTWLNASSIGIEIVHQPFVPGTEAAAAPTWAPYAPAQIEAVVALARDIIARHGIRPENVVGHSDIAPTRKQDPGPAFPWQQLAEHGVGRWYDPQQVQRWQAVLADRSPPDLAWFAPRLRTLGYAIAPAATHAGFDPVATRAALRAFQMHWRPQPHHGEPDRESAAIVLALLGCEPTVPSGQRHHNTAPDRPCLP